MLIICEYQEDESLTIIPISLILVIVKIILHLQREINEVEVADEASYYVAEKIELDLCILWEDKNMSNKIDNI